VAVGGGARPRWRGRATAASLPAFSRYKGQLPLVLARGGCFPLPGRPWRREGGGGSVELAGFGQDLEVGGAALPSGALAQLRWVIPGGGCSASMEEAWLSSSR
jgi:hypothetical protein